MKTAAPGKIIISGEHAVVYGKPALSMAVNCFATTTINKQNSQKTSFRLNNYNLKASVTLQQLQAIEKNLTQQYQAFLRGQHSIHDVLKTPTYLLQFTLSRLLNHIHNNLPHGFCININSTIPIGCGMGSSAAIILSLIHAIANQLEIKLTQKEYFKLGCETEQLQHGYASGIDIYTSLEGGSIRFQAGHAEQRPLPQLPMYLVNTGKPCTTTGECVTQVSQRFRRDYVLWNSFENITESIDKNFTNLNYLPNLIRENHQLLVHIGVVPEKVQQFIKNLEKNKAAAKICGAGAIAGEKAGIVLILAKSKQMVEALSSQYHYSLLDFQGEPHGLRTL